MGNSEPKRHHYVPQFLLKHFLDPHGFLWMHSLDKVDVYCSSIGNAFLKKFNHRTYLLDETSDCKDLIYHNQAEEKLCNYESQAAPILEMVIDSVRRKKTPTLSREQDYTFKRFLDLMSRRTPEVVEETLCTWAEFDKLIDLSNQATVNVLSLPTAQKEAFLRDNWITDHKSQIIQNAKVNFILGEFPSVEASRLKYYSESGLLLYVIRTPTKSFAIGSRGGVNVSLDGYGRPCQKVQWFPLAPDVAVCFHSELGLSLTSSDYGQGSNFIEGFNQSTARQSHIIASNSKTLAHTLAHQRNEDSDNAANPSPV